MNKEKNIEELFKSAFESFEAPVDPSVWTAVQSGITANSAATAVAAKTTAGIIKTIIISGTTLVAGLGLGYVFFNNSNTTALPENGEYIAPKDKVEILDADGNVIESSTITESTKPAEQKMVEVVIPVEDKKTGKTEVIKITVPENEYSASSIVDEMISESDRQRWNNYYETTRAKEEIKDGQNKTTNEKTVTEEKEPTRVDIKELAEGLPVAFITSTKEMGTAPLIIEFSNSTEEYSYHWDFGDGTVSTENTPEHIFREPGSYTVKLTVKNKAGKSATGRKTIEVISPMEFTKIPNVFSPNNDGTNDKYRVIGNNIKLFTISIYNKNGNLLFRSNDIEEGWNGEDPKGNPMPEGIYLVVIDAVGFDNTPYRKGDSFRLER